jgi:hypothetical protein
MSSPDEAGPRRDDRPREELRVREDLGLRKLDAPVSAMPSADGSEQPTLTAPPLAERAGV